VSDVKQFWDGRAADPALDASQVTHPDIWQRWLEIETIKTLVSSRDRVIDVGCGAGYATKQIAPFVSEILGTDFSAGMIKRALSDEADVPPNARFEVADVLNLSADQFGMFDVALTTRCLINLPDWPAQQRALRNIARVVKPGGLYIFVEGRSDGRAALNRLRQAMGLEPMPTVWHNLDFDRAGTLGFLDEYFRLEREIGFGTYDLIARVVHPLLVAPNPPEYAAKINEIAARAALHRPNDLENSRVALFCLRRR
jgi:SAM-dependent methyltransferase